MIEKKDWEGILKLITDDRDKLIKGYELNLPQFDNLIELCKKKISEFPVEEKKDADPMPEELKEVLPIVK